MSTERIDALERIRSIILDGVHRLEHILSSLRLLDEDIDDKYHGRWDGWKHTKWLRREIEHFLGCRQGYSVPSFEELFREAHSLDRKHGVLHALYHSNKKTQPPVSVLGESYRNWSEAALGYSEGTGVLYSALEAMEFVYEWFSEDSRVPYEQWREELQKITAEFGEMPREQFGRWRLSIEREFDLTIDEFEIENDDVPEESDSRKVTSAAPEGHLGLIVDVDHRTIRRRGHDAMIDLRNKGAVWDTFMAFYKAGDEDASEESWKTAFSGEWSGRRMIVTRLREELVALAITIPNGGRRLVNDGA